MAALASGFTLLMASAVVLAQGPPGGPGGFGGMFGPGGPGGPGGQSVASLVLVPSVQKDLPLTDKQTAQLKKLEASVRQKRRALFSNNGDEGTDPRQRFQAMGSLQRDFEAAIMKMLTKRQKDRLAQIDLQREGVLAVARKDVATKIKLTTSQNKKIKTIVDGMRKSIAQAMPRPPGGPGGGGPGGGPGGGGPGGGGFPGGPGGGGFPGGPGGGGFPGGGQGAGLDGANPNPNGGNPQADGNGAGGGRRNRGGGPGGGPGGPGGGPPNFNDPEFQARMAKIREQVDSTRKEAAAKVEDVLTSDQKAAFAKLQGEPFDVSTLRGPGGFGRPGGPGAGNGNGNDNADDNGGSSGGRPAARTKARRGAAR